ncbi:zinc finger protein 473 [Grammomys surdaster]|uniref:zinc finger protein 473 n=1 Tax=Grammomys surdaster TaxID=491861 RepID=UPI00109FF138|nr:zinc finger protein 473 [Grammomys surdaster]
MERKEEELKRGHWNQAAMAEELVTLKDVAMDFTLEDWEDLESELDQRDVFWDAELNNYQDLFSFNPPQPSLISQPDVREELKATSTEVPETKNCPLQNGFLEEDLSQIMEIFSNEELNFEACIAYKASENSYTC